MPYSDKDIVNLREKRAEDAKQADQIIRQASEEGRELTNEERSKIDEIHEAVDARGKDVERMERQNELQSSMEKSEGRAASLESQSGGARGGESQRDEFDKNIRNWLMGYGGKQYNLRSFLSQRELAPMLEEFRSARTPREARKMAMEARAQSVGTDSEGGYTAPQDFADRLEVAMLQFGGMRQARTTIMRTADGNKLPMPTVDDTSNKGTIISENTKISEQDVTFGNTDLDAFKYTSKAIRVSFELLQDSAFDMPSFLGDALGERIGRITNEHFTTGDHSSKPNGLVTAAPVGHTGSNTGSFDYSDFVELEHSVDAAYRRNAEWMMSDAAVKEAKLLTDDNSNPIFVPGIALREPDTILGYRYVVNQDMDSVATDNKPVAFGDMSKYHIRDVQDIQLIRLDEVYAEWGQVAFLAFSRHDGDLLDAGTNPVKVLQMAPS